MARVSAYDCGLICIGVASSSIMALMLTGQFSAIKVVALSGALLAILAALMQARGVRGTRIRPDLWLIAVLAVALFFRSNFSTNYIGGNDSGLYVTFSGIVEHYGGMYATDSFRLTLPDELRAVYDRGSIPGMLPIDGSQFYAVFYPLHPGWMAFFSSIFGQDNHGLSVLMFSMLGVTGAYYLTAELSDDLSAARLAALLMAVNPALCYLGKLPFTEAQSTALLLNGAYLLVKAIRGAAPQRLLFVASVLLLTMLIFTRLNFVILVAPWSALYILSYSGRLEEMTAARLRAYLFGLIVCIGIALVVYRIALPYLFQSILVDVQLGFLQRHPSLILLLAASAIGLLASPWLSHAMDRPIQLTERTATWLPIAALIVSLWSLVGLVKSGASFYGLEIPPSSGNFKLHIVYRLVEILTPFLFAALVFLPWGKKTTSLTIPCIFLASSLILTTAYSPALPYLWYHGRYLASEAVPFAIVIISIVLSRRAAMAMTVAVPSLATMTFFAAVELRHTEAEDASFFHELDRSVATSDVLLADERHMDARFPVPIRFFFRKNLFLIPKDATPDERTAIISRFSRSLFLSPELSQEPNIPKTLERVIEYRENRLLEGESILPPVSWHSPSLRFNLYRLKGS